MKKILKAVLLLGTLFTPSILSAQNEPVINSTVSGKIIDARTQENLIGATVKIKGTTNGGTTDQNGEFTLLTGQKLLSYKKQTNQAGNSWANLAEHKANNWRARTLINELVYFEHRQI